MRRARRLRLLAALLAGASALGLAGAAAGREVAADAWIAYHLSQRLDDPLLRGVSADGRDRISFGTARESAWSPDGAQLALVTRAATAEETDLWLVAADGSTRRLLSGEPGSEARPRWSPDGRLVAFSHVPRGGDRRTPGALVVLDPVTGRRWTLAEDVAGGAPSWSPDGSQLVYAAVRARPALGDVRGSDLVVVAADGAAPPRQLTETSTPEAGPTAALAPRWSPDGPWIAYVRRRPGDPYAHGDLWLARPDGTHDRRLLERVREGFAWSPDGRRIAFTPDPTMPCSRFCDAPPPPHLRSEIRVLAPEGGPVRALTGTGAEHSPAWSEDGAKIAFVGPRGVYAMNADGSCETLVASLGWGPAWQPARSSGPRLECVDVRVSGGPVSPRHIDGVLSGALVRYRLEVESSGTRPARGVTLRLRHGSILVPRQARAQGGTCSTRPAVLCRWDTLAAGARRTVTVDLVASRAAVEAAAGDRMRLLPDSLRFAVAVANDRNLLDNVLRIREQVWSCTLRGTTQADRLRGTPGRDRICGVDGDDVIHALGGDDVIDGGVGSDLIVPGPGRDLVRGGPGDDTILAADGERDTIRCGPGRDRVVADRIDVVARDCERVERR